MTEFFGRVDINGTKHELHTDNMTLYTHIGRHATFNHVFANLTDEIGMYFWADHPQYDNAASFIEQNDGMQVLNMRQVSQHDEEMYIRGHMGNIDTVPEDW